MCCSVQIHGWAFYSIIFAHMVCMAVGIQVRVEGMPIVRQVDDTLSIMKINPALGIVSFILFTITVLSSLEYFRRHHWGKFYVTHFAFFPAVVFALFHARVFNLPWLAAAAGFFYIDVGIRFHMKFMRKSKVEAAAVLPDGVVKLTISTGNSMAYEAGQYVWLALPGVVGAGPLAGFAFHPYSISSAYKPGDPTYTVHMKCMGPGTWSEAVLKAVEANGVEAFKGGCRVGGPSGRFSINPTHFERIVIVAGGIGAPPLFSLLADVVRDAAASPKDAAARRYPAAKAAPRSGRPVLKASCASTSAVGRGAATVATAAGTLSEPSA
jgi:predicted ferric reductase